MTDGRSAIRAFILLSEQCAWLAEENILLSSDRDICILRITRESLRGELLGIVKELLRLELMQVGQHQLRCLAFVKVVPIGARIGRELL